MDFLWRIGEWTVILHSDYLLPLLSPTGPRQLYWTANGAGCQPERPQSPLSLGPSSCQKVFQMFLSRVSLLFYYCKFNPLRIMVTIKVTSLETECEYDLRVHSHGSLTTLVSNSERGRERTYSSVLSQIHHH